ncbi:MAG TPA: protein kinase [Polyangiaceae bacterium]|nr:protein kinase [Polyangiaceae bacterium]
MVRPPFRCIHCGRLHAGDEVRCPLTGRSIDARAGGPAQPPPLPSAPPPPPSAPPESERRDLIGRILEDKYRPTAVLGEGGMGTVYEAEHLLIGRRVALKVLHPAHAQRRDAVWRFRHEARVAGSIGHPNICEIYDVGQLDDGSPFLVMERLHGETLADRIERETELPFLDVIDVTLQVLSALVTAHDKGIIHRDIKPENIFLSERPGFAPTAKLLDFGISKAVADEDLHLTRTGMVMGTPYYMAPEQARGEVIDARIDLYAVGAVLYESLTGQRPFAASNYSALLRLILFEEPRPLRALRPSLPEPFDHVVGRALAKDREHRFQSAQEFMAALAGLRAEVVAYRPSSSDLDRLVQPFRPADRPAAAPPPSAGPAAGKPHTPAPGTPSPQAPRSVPPLFSNEPTRHGLGPLPPAASAPPPPARANSAPPPARANSAPPPARANSAPPAAAASAPPTPPASLAPPPGPRPVVENDATLATAPLNIDEAEAIVRSAAERARASRPPPHASGSGASGSAFPPPLPPSAGHRSNPPGPLPPRASSLPRPNVSPSAPPPPPYRPKNPSLPPLPAPPSAPPRPRSEVPRPHEAGPATPVPPAAAPLPPAGPYRGPLPPPPAARRPAASIPAAPGSPAGPADHRPALGSDPPPGFSEDDENLPTKLYRPNPGDLPLPPRQKPPAKKEP